MLGKDLFINAFLEIKRITKLEDKYALNVCCLLPTKKIDFFVLDGYGWGTVNRISDSLIDNIKEFIDKNNIEYYKYEELEAKYPLIYKKLSNLTIDTYDLSKYCEKANESISNFKYFKFNSKMIQMFLLEQKNIEFKEDNTSHFSLTERGINNGFEIEQRESYRGDIYSVIKLNKKACGFLNKMLPYIFYWFYAFNPLNYYRTNPEMDFQFKEKEKKLLIFDLDGTIFDTDFLRQDRNDYSLLNKVKYIKGFEKNFLDKNSSLNVIYNDFLIVTSSSFSYYSKLLNIYSDLKKNLNWEVLGTSYKKRDLRAFLQNVKQEYTDVIAFGDDEKDANVYSELGLDYYIVDNYYGYNKTDKEIIEISKRNKKYEFRNNYLYDLKKCYSNGENQFKSDYFDDIVIYYKHYYNTYRINEFGYQEGSDFAPAIRKVKPLKVYNIYEMGKLSKNDTIIQQIDYFASTFNDLYIDENVVLIRVPGHDEVVHNFNKPMSRLIRKIINNHKKGVNGEEYLRRKKVEPESKSGNRSIWRHLSSIEILDSYKPLLKGKTVYLFDDICTSGTSMMACVELLYRAKVAHVVCFCLCRTCGHDKYAPKEIG